MQQMDFEYHIPNHPLTLDAGLALFRDVYMPARNYSIRTREEYLSDLQDLARLLQSNGIETIQAVGLRDLQHYLADLDRRQLAPASRNRKTFSIKTFFKFLVRAGYLANDPASALIPPEIPEKERRFLTEEEFKRILAEASTIRDKAILEVFLQTGLRLSELIHLSVDDLELPRRITRDPENVGAGSRLEW
jgi:site-specific recombinase XerD